MATTIVYAIAAIVADLQLMPSIILEERLKHTYLDVDF